MLVSCVPSVRANLILACYFEILMIHCIDQGLKKVLFSCMGQEDFATVQVTFHSYSPIGKGPGQGIRQHDQANH